MAKDLQKLCEDYVKQLDTTIKSLNAFQKQAGDTTAFKRTLQQCVMVNFKD